MIDRRAHAADEVGEHLVALDRRPWPDLFDTSEPNGSVAAHLRRCGIRPASCACRRGGSGNWRGCEAAFCGRVTSVISPRLFGRQTLKMKVKPGQPCNPSFKPSEEKFSTWYCRSGTGSVGLDLASSVASVAPTASWPVPVNSHCSAILADLSGFITASLSVSPLWVVQTKKWPGNDPAGS